MSRDDAARFYGVAVLVTISVVAIVSQLCWMNHIPQTIFKAVKSFCSSFPSAIGSSSGTSPTGSIGIIPDRPQTMMAASAPYHRPRDITEIDEVAIFLAEVRRSALTQPTSFPSNRARQEFISNLLITKRVVAASSSSFMKDGVQLWGDDDRVLVVQGGDEDVDVESGMVGSTTPTNEEEEQDMPCAICLLNYRPGDLVCFSHNIKCNHHFHAACISRWLIQDRDDCPCCRNNYLALSDDEDADGVEDEDDGEIEDENDYQQGEPTAEAVQPTAPNEHNWIPSYLAPFYSSSRNVDPQFEPTIIDERRHGPVSTALSSRDVMTDVQVGAWTDDEDSRVEDHRRPDPDEWSCPSVEDPEEEFVDVYPSRQRYRRHPRRISRPLPSSSRDELSGSNEQSQSLELGDLILEGLMQRLQDRAEEQSTRTASSSSLYTEGTEAEAPENTSGCAPVNVPRDQLEVCAICRNEYSVNEELCWSQDPACAHVFHRRCMQEWISNHDYCPFCIPEQGSSSLQQSAGLLSNFSQPQHPAEVSLDSRDSRDSETATTTTKGSEGTIIANHDNEAVMP